MTGSCSKDYFLNDDPGILWILLKIVGKHCAYCLINGSHNLCISQFCFCLTFKLRFLYFYGYYSSQILHENHPR